MDIFRYRTNKYKPPCTTAGTDTKVERDKTVKQAMTGSRLCRKALAIGVLTALSLGSTVLTTFPAQAAGKPPLILTVTGPQNGATHLPLEGINIQLVNPGQPKPSSRLRFYVHDELDRDVSPDDIKIEVQEGNSWNEVQVEAIDGGVMGAIGEDGPPHQKIHDKGGFPISAKANKKWQLRITFRYPGAYTLVTAVSPDNGNTHLAQPVSLSLEAL